MSDYQKAKIYKLWSPQGTEDEVYYGSTCRELRFRKQGHKNKNNKCQSKILFDNYDDVRIELLEDYPCNNRTELEKKEGEYIRNNKCLNKIISGRTKKEWCEDNKESIAKLMKEYRLKNKDKRNVTQREWRRKNKEEALIKE
tara:strand:- start:14 stop:439 length:426 start_codon:yes stop_codon:yes gene_type:complete